MALISPAAKPVEVIEEHCWCCEEVKFEAVTKPTAVPAAAATAAAAANGVSEDNVPSGEGDTTAINIGAIGENYDFGVFFREINFTEK